MARNHIQNRHLFGSLVGVNNNVTVFGVSQCRAAIETTCQIGGRRKKKAGGREVGEMSLELERRRNWSQTQQTTSGSLTAA